MANGRSGLEPSEARSAIGLRRVLSTLALVSGLVATAVFAALALRGDDPTPAGVGAVICAVVVLVAAADLVVLRRRYGRT